MGRAVSIFLDACIVIYLVEGNDGFSEQIGDAMRGVGPALFCVNDLVRLECLVGPLRRHDADLRAAYVRQFEALRVLDMGREVYDLAAELRAHHGVKTPDALHAATAIQHGCDELWTGDSRLAAIGTRIKLRVFGNVRA